MNTNLFHLLRLWLLAFIALPASAQVGVTLTAAEGKPGEEVMVSVSLTNSEVLSGLQLLFEVPIGADFHLLTASTIGRASSFSASAGIRDGKASVMLFHPQGGTIATGEGEVVRFIVQLGKLPLDVNLPVQVKATDATGNALRVGSTSMQLVCRQPKAQYSVTNIDFGRVPLNQHPVQMLSVSNVGTAPLVIDGLQLEGAGFSSSTSFPLTIEAGQQRSIDVTFTPNERGKVSGTMRLNCNSTLTNNQITLQATPYAVNEIHVGNAQGYSDSVVTVELTMNNMDAINGFTLEFDLPDQLQYIDGSFTLSNRSQGHQVQANLVGTRLKVNAYSLQNKSFLGKEGKLATFQVRLKGKYGVELAPAKASLAAFYKGEVLNVLSATYGGRIDIAYPTLSLQTQLDLGRTPVTQAAKVSLPFNNYGSAPLVIDRLVSNQEQVRVVSVLPLKVQPWGEGTIDLEISNKLEGLIEGILQVYSNDPDQRLVNVNFHGERFAPNQLAFTVRDMPQNSQKFPIALELSNYDGISGVQFDLHYPAGITPRDEIVWTDRTQGFTCSHRQVGPQTERYFIYSLQGDTIAKGEGKVGDLWFDLSPSIAQGSYPLSVKQIKLSTPQLADKHSQLNDLHFTLRVTPAFYPVTSLQLEKDTLTFRLDESVRLVAQVLPVEASNKVLHWTSSDERIATIDSDGRITPLKTGKVRFTVTTTDGSQLSAHCGAEILSPLATQITLRPTTLSLYVGETSQLVSQVIPMQAAQDVSFTSSHPAIVSVDELGRVKAHALGHAVITVTANDGSGASAKCEVSVNEVTALDYVLYKSNQRMIIYTLDGVRLYLKFKDLKPGLYIVNGKKIKKVVR